MQRFQVLLSVFLLINLSVCAQQNFKIEGRITDSETQEGLFGVNLVLPALEIGTVTDENGHFSLLAPEGKYKLSISYIGYQTILKKINITRNQSLNFQLNPSSENLGKVIIRQKNNLLNLRKPEMSVNTLSSEEIKKIPVVFGETDLIKALLLLPGVSVAGEGSSGFNVRGGSGDQNLVLMDQATLFSDSHLFGFFSVLNSDAIDNLKLYKGGIPAKYGDRISSVLEIKQKTGDVRKFKATGGIGVVSSRLMLEGPIQKNKSSFLISGRSSYAHLFLKLIDNPNSAYFYDLNTKLNFDLDPKNTLSFSGYFGRDVININESFKNDYGDAVADLNWEHEFSEKLHSNLYAIYSDYYFGLTLDFVGFNYRSGITNFKLNYTFDHTVSENLKLNYGLETSYYIIDPGYIEPARENAGFNTRQIAKKHAWENVLFLQADQELSEKFSVSYGARLSNFNRLGQRDLHNYVNAQPLLFNQDLQIYEKAPIESSYNQSSGDILKSFWNIEPRASVAYQLNDYSALKANYQRTVQYLQLLTNSSAPAPLDIWAPSGSYIQPLKSDQVALGYFRNFKKYGLTLETEVFYKTTQNKIDYIAGADLIANEAIEQVILNGKSRAYGLEFLLKKTTGKFTGWFAYTLSKSEQQTPGRNAMEPGINQGKWYNTAWDKTHDFSVVGNYEFSNKWSFNAAFVLQTGRPVTYPTSQYRYQNYVVPNYGDRNSNRLPVYHHLDFSATLTPKSNKNRKWQAEWTFGIYNIYNRKNAASINFSNNEDTGGNEATRLAIFGIVPSVSYNFKF